MDKETKSSLKQDNAEDIDLKNKMAIAHNVLRACIEENNANWCMYRTEEDQRLHYLTNLPKSVITKILEDDEIPPAADAIENNMPNTPKLDLAIRRGLIDLYMDKEIPTTRSMQGVIAELSRDRKGCKSQLKRSGYIWKRLPQTKRAIIMEHPQHTLQRQRYLKKMKHHRELNRNIVYVMDKIMEKEDADINYFKNYMNPQDSYVGSIVIVARCKYIGGTVFTCNSIAKCQEIFEQTFLEDILHELPESSVIVLEENPYYNKTLPVPTIESEKCDMIKWLYINNIPCDNGNHRGELFEMIQRLKVKADLNKFDAILRARGHEILRRPHKTSYLCYFRPIWENASRLADGAKDITEVIINSEYSYWQTLQNTLIANEKLVYSEDLATENVIDKILTMARTLNISGWANIECDLEENSLKQEECFIEI